MKATWLAAGLAVVVAALGCCQVAAARQAVALTPSKDNTLYESDTGALSNGAGAHLFTGRTGLGDARRALLAFDLAGAVPAGASIDSVTLTLHLSRTVARAQTVALHRVLAGWGEGASDAADNEGMGADVTAGEASWIHTFFDTGAWQNAGGDVAAEASAEALVAGEGAYTWGPTPAMAADVQAWLDAPEENFGWMLRGDEAATTTAKRFDSREHPEAAARPVLRVFFSIPAGVADEEVPDAPRLAQNYPNPFHRTTTISYTLHAPQPVTLEVFDALGRAVATLVQAHQQAGTHAVRFDADGLPEGVYLYRLTAGHVRQYRLMVALR